MSDGTGGHMDGRGRHLAGRASASSTAEPVWDRGSGVWHCQDKFPGLDAGQQIGRYSRRTPCLLPVRWLSAVSAVGPGHVVDKPRFSRICRVTAWAALLLWHITDLPVSLKRERSPCPDASPGMDCVKSTSLSTWAGLLEGSWGVGRRWLTGTVTEAHTHTVHLSDMEQPGTENVQVGESISRQTHESLHPVWGGEGCRTAADTANSTRMPLTAGLPHGRVSPATGGSRGHVYKEHRG